MTFLWNSALRMSVLLALGLVCLVLFRKRSAAFRHSLLATTLLFAAMTPILVYFVPAWKVIPTRRPSLQTSVVTPRIQPRKEQSVSGALPSRTGGSAHPENSFAFIWAIGCLIHLGITLSGFYRLRTIGAASVPIGDPRWMNLAEKIQSEYRLRQRVVLLQSRNPAMLVTWGAWRPKILLPTGAAYWSDNQIRAALYHELAHVRRLDWLMQTLSEAVKSVYWFNPLLWLTCSRLRLESEHSCDDAVLSRGMSATEYAGHLLEIIGSLQHPDRAWSSALGMARIPTIERRFKAMLNSRADRRSLSGSVAAMILIIGAVVAIPVAAISSSSASIEALPPAAAAVASVSVVHTETPATKPVTLPASKPMSIQDTPSASEQRTENQLISLDFDNADIRDVFRVMADASGFNVALDPDVGGTVNFHIQQQPWHEVLDRLVRNLNLTYTIYRTNGRPVLQVSNAGILPGPSAIPILRQSPNGSGSNPDKTPDFGTSEPVILSNTHGYDLNWYVDQLANVVRLNWYPKIPSISKTIKGLVVLTVTVLKDGSFKGVNIVSSSGVPDLDVAASQAVVARFPALPADFPDDHITIQLTFRYNIP